MHVLGNEMKMNRYHVSCNSRRRPSNGEAVSVRKLGAGMWHLTEEFTAVNRCCSFNIHPLHSWIPIPKSAMEGATKWEPCHKKISSSDGIVKLYEDRLTATTSSPALLLQLIKAQNCIQELEAERVRLRKKVKHLVRNLTEERTSWMRRERHKMHAAIDGLKDDLRRERRNLKQLDVINSKLLVDLADSKLSARQCMQHYQNERKSRKLLEDMCNRLVKEIEKGKAEIESLKSESARIGEEVEEERKMLQLAEVWREERVQMKLIDAKQILEEKYCLMNNVISALESFLRSKNVTVDTADFSEMLMVKQVVDSLNIHETNMFSAVSPASNDKYTNNEGSIICEVTKLRADQCTDYSTPGQYSAIQIAGSENRRCAPNTSSECLNGILDHDKSCNDACAREPVIQAEDQFLNNIVGETNHSVNGIVGYKSILSGIVNQEQETVQSDSVDCETKEISLGLLNQSKKRGSSFRKLWRSSLSSDDFCKKIPLDENGRLPNGSNVHVVSLENVPAERALADQEFVNHCCSAGPRNPHLTRAMKGCIEWPRGIPKHGFNTKLSEARFESQKSQLCTILKHRN